uniref:Broad-complex core protein isoform 6 n=1 Tax=Caligus rogercresseyi TaxID=217165 RepID=C1BQJ2_CALRO|nr:Broad-complex core protein isoform 6 [Caligus rogercresseyi]
MSSGETLCLRWNEFESSIKQGFSELRSNENFFDVTLACGSDVIRAHRVILSACSSFFRSLLTSIPHSNPYLYLRGIELKHLESILCFMYNGEVRVQHEDLDQFLLVAQELCVNGLVQEDSKISPPKEEEEEERTPSSSTQRRRECSSSPPPIKRQLRASSHLEEEHHQILEPSSSPVDEQSLEEEDDGNYVFINNYDVQESERTNGSSEYG